MLCVVRMDKKYNTVAVFGPFSSYESVEAFLIEASDTDGQLFDFRVQPMRCEEEYTNPDLAEKRYGERFAGLVIAECNRSYIQLLACLAKFGFWPSPWRYRHSIRQKIAAVKAGEDSEAA